LERSLLTAMSLLLSQQRQHPLPDLFRSSYIIKTNNILSVPVKQALVNYFRANDLGEDGGLNKAWARLKIGNFYIPFPNTASRKKALVLHDIHHLVTGYNTDWKGEVSISAWEISSGCGKYYAAWVLDLGGLAIGLFLYPVSVFKAFIRGRRTRNLYDNHIPKEQALEMTVTALAVKLLLNKEMEKPPAPAELLAFIFWSFSSIVFTLLPAIFFILFLRWQV
jgi:hypothetical protein